MILCFLIRWSTLLLAIHGISVESIQEEGSVPKGFANPDFWRRRPDYPVKDTVLLDRFVAPVGSQEALSIESGFHAQTSSSCADVPDILDTWSDARFPEPGARGNTCGDLSLPLEEQLAKIFATGKVAQNASMDNVVSWTVVDGAYVVLARPWVESFRKNSMGEPLFVSMSDGASKWLCESGFQVVQQHVANATHGLSWQIGLSKFQVSELIAKLGYISFFLELDVYVNRNPINQLLKEAGLEGRSGSFKPGDAYKQDLILNREYMGPWEYNIGTMFALPTPNVTFLFTRLREMYALDNNTDYGTNHRIPAADQKYINAVLLGKYQFGKCKKFYGQTRRFGPDKMAMKAVCDKAEELHQIISVKNGVATKIFSEQNHCDDPLEHDAIHILGRKQGSFWAESMTNKIQTAANLRIGEGIDNMYYEEVPSTTKYVLFDNVPFGSNDVLKRSVAVMEFMTIVAKMTSRAMVYPAQTLPNGIVSFGEDFVHPLAFAHIGVDTRESMFVANQRLNKDLLYPVTRVVFTTGPSLYVEVHLSATEKKPATVAPKTQLLEMLRTTLADAKTLVFSLADQADWSAMESFVKDQNEQCSEVKAYLDIIREHQCELNYAVGERLRRSCMSYSGKSLCLKIPHGAIVKGTKLPVF